MSPSEVGKRVSDRGERRPIAESGEFPARLEEAIGLLRSSEEHGENCGIPHQGDPDQSARCTCGLDGRAERAEDLIAEEYDAALASAPDGLTRADAFVQGGRALAKALLELDAVDSERLSGDDIGEASYATVSAALPAIEADLPAFPTQQEDTPDA